MESSNMTSNVSADVMRKTQEVRLRGGASFRFPTFKCVRTLGTHPHTHTRQSFPTEAPPRVVYAVSSYTQYQERYAFDSSTGHEFDFTLRRHPIGEVDGETENGIHDLRRSDPAVAAGCTILQIIVKPRTLPAGPPWARPVSVHRRDVANPKDGLPGARRHAAQADQQDVIQGVLVLPDPQPLAVLRIV